MITAAEGQAEKVTAQDLDQVGHFLRDDLIDPGIDSIRRDRAAFEMKIDRSKMATGVGEVELNLVGGQFTGRVVMNEV